MTREKVMAEHHGGVVADHPHPVSAVGVTSGTLTTPRGPITWTAAENGTVHAEGGGQQLTSTGRSETNGSWHQHQVVARDHGAVYLTIDSVVDATSRKVAVTLQAGTSHLTLAVSGIDARVTSGTAHVSGAVRGSAVHWTGRVDLTSNP